MASCSSASSARTSSSREAFQFLQQVLIIPAGLLDLFQLDRLGQLRHRELAAVHHFQRELHAVDLAHAREQLHGQQRVAAQLEEVVVDADRRNVQQPRPELRQVALERRARRIATARAARACGWRRGSAPESRRACAARWRSCR